MSFRLLVLGWRSLSIYRGLFKWLTSMTLNSFSLVLFEVYLFYSVSTIKDIHALVCADGVKKSPYSFRKDPWFFLTSASLVDPFPFVAYPELLFAGIESLLLFYNFCIFCSICCFNMLFKFFLSKGSPLVFSTFILKS